MHLMIVVYFWLLNWTNFVFPYLSECVIIIILNGGTAKGIPFLASFDAAFNILFARFPHCQDLLMPRPACLQFRLLTYQALDMPEGLRNGLSALSPLPCGLHCSFFLDERLLHYVMLSTLRSYLRPPSILPAIPFTANVAAGFFQLIYHKHGFLPLSSDTFKV